ncbi:class I SAM-dependent methyltransferase, partial [Candidatus Omnitrophota bacterium]
MQKAHAEGRITDVAKDLRDFLGGSYVYSGILNSGAIRVFLPDEKIWITSFNPVKESPFLAKSKDEIATRATVSINDDLAIEIVQGKSEAVNEAENDTEATLALDIFKNMRELKMVKDGTEEVLLLMPLVPGEGKETPAVAVNLSWIRDYHYLLYGNKPLNEWSRKYPGVGEIGQQKDLEDLSIWPIVSFGEPDKDIMEWVAHGGTRDPPPAYMHAARISLSQLREKSGFTEGAETTAMNYPEVIALIDGVKFYFPYVSFIGDMTRVIEGKGLKRDPDWFRTFEGHPTRWRGTQCTICGSDQAVTQHIVGPSRIVACKRCGTERDNPRAVLSEKDLAKYATGEKLLFEGKIQNMQRAEFVAGDIIGLLRARYPEVVNGPLLDLGCSSGELLCVLRDEYGWPNENLFGVEPSGYAAGFARKNYGLSVKHGTVMSAGYEDKKFKTVLIANTIEHLEDPLGALKEISRIMADDGVLYIVGVPNQKSLISFYETGRFTQKHFPDGQHMFHFNQETLSRMVSKAGFSIDRIYGDPRGYAGNKPLESALWYAWNVGVDVENTKDDTALLLKRLKVVFTELCGKIQKTWGAHYTYEIKENDFDTIESFLRFYRREIWDSPYLSESIEICAKKSKLAGTAPVGNLFAGFNAVVNTKSLRRNYFTREKFRGARHKNTEEHFSYRTIATELEGLVALGVLQADKSEKPFKYKLNKRIASSTSRIKKVREALKALPARPDNRRLRALRTNFEKNGLLMGQKDAQEEFNKAKNLLLAEAGHSAKKKIEAVRTIKKWNHSTEALSVLAQALLKHKHLKGLSGEIIAAIRAVKQDGILKNKRGIVQNSIIGTIWSTLADFGVDRDKVTLIIDNPYDAIKLKYHSTRPFTRCNSFIKQLKKAYRGRRSRIDAEITHDITPSSTEGTISLNFNITASNLTDFWRQTGTQGFRSNAEEFHRAFTKEEIITKLERRIKSLLDGITNDDEYQSFVAYVWGDGTDDNPGMINIVRNQEKHGDRDVIKVESSTTRDPYTKFSRADNRCTFNELSLLAKYNPYFSHYIPEADIQRWVYLARAAGSVFVTAYIKGLFKGSLDKDYMFFVSKDTMGLNLAEVLNTEISKLTGYIHHVDENGEDSHEHVKNYTAVRLAMMSFLRKRYYKQVQILIGGKEGWVKFRKVKVRRDKSGLNRYEDMPVYDSPSKGARIMARVKRYKAYGEALAIKSVTMIDRDQNNHAQERKLSADEIAQIRTITSVGPDGVARTCQGIGYRTDPDYPYLINALYKQFMRTPIFEKLKRRDSRGNVIVPKVCVIDEVADGSWDFLTIFTLEELSRDTDFDEEALKQKCELVLGRDLWHLRSAIPYNLSEEEIREWEKLEETIKKLRRTDKSVDIVAFIGSPRSWGAQRTPGYPAMQIEALKRDFEMSDEAAALAIKSTTAGADFIPHSFMVDDDKAPLRPIYDDIPIKLETREIHLGAYLKAILLYCGVVEFYKEEYKKLGLKSLVRLINDPDVEASLKIKALEALVDFPYETSLKSLSGIASRQPGLSDKAEEVAILIFKKIMTEALDFDRSGKIMGIKNYENLFHREKLVRDQLKSSVPRVKEIAENMLKHTENARTRLTVVGVAFDVYNALSINERSQLKFYEHSGSVIYLAPLMSHQTEDMESEILTLKNDLGATREVLPQFQSDESAITSDLVKERIASAIKEKYGFARAIEEARTELATTGEVNLGALGDKHNLTQAQLTELAKEVHPGQGMGPASAAGAMRETRNHEQPKSGPQAKSSKKKTLYAKVLIGSLILLTAGFALLANFYFPAILTSLPYYVNTMIYFGLGETLSQLYHRLVEREKFDLNKIAISAIAYGLLFGKVWGWFYDCYITFIPNNMVAGKL